MCLCAARRTGTADCASQAARACRNLGKEVSQQALGGRPRRPERLRNRTALEEALEEHLDDGTDGQVLDEMPRQSSAHVGHTGQSLDV